MVPKSNSSSFGIFGVCINFLILKKGQTGNFNISVDYNRSNQVIEILKYVKPHRRSHLTSGHKKTFI